MHLESDSTKLSEQLLRQVELDSFLALAKAKFSLEVSELTGLLCVDFRVETEHEFGRQLWYFDAMGVDSKERVSECFGVIQYSVEYGLLELVEGHVFDCPNERQHFHHFYQAGKRTTHWMHPANRWLLLGLLGVGLVWLAYLAFLVWK